MIGAFRTEVSFTTAIVEVAIMAKWLVHHDRGEMRRHIQGVVGFPDLVLLRPPRLIFAELKMKSGHLGPEQRRWGEQLQAVGAEWHLWTPDDWPHIVDTLCRR